MSKEIPRRTFLKLAGAAALSGAGFLAGFFTREFTQGEKQQSAEEKFQSLLSFLANSEIPALKQVSYEYRNLQEDPLYQMVFITDLFPFIREPVDLDFVGGFKAGDSQWRIVISKAALLNQLPRLKFSKEDWAIYLYKTLLIFKAVNKVEGTAKEEHDALTTELETQIWRQVWGDVGQEFAQKTFDPYLQSKLAEFQTTLQNK